MPTKERRRASREDADTILSLIFALSGDLHKSQTMLRKDKRKKKRSLIRYFQRRGGRKGKSVPGVKYDLVALAILLIQKLKVVHGPAAFGFG